MRGQPFLDPFTHFGVSYTKHGHLSGYKNEQNDLPLPSSHTQPPQQPPKAKLPIPPSSTPKGPAFTSVSQITSYLKVDNIQAEVKSLEPDWPLFALKELGANCYDFLRVRYPKAPKESRKVAFRVKVDSGILRINARNSNVDNVEVFKNLDQIFDYKRWGSEKRNQHNLTQGSLGDFLKRVLGMGYASWNSIVEDENLLQNRQWPEPVILRFNKKEYRVFLIVDEGLDGTPNPYPRFEGPFPYEDASNYTEVEIALPVKHLYRNPIQQKILLGKLQQFYKVHTMAPRNIEFSFVNGGVTDKQ